MTLARVGSNSYRIWTGNIGTDSKVGDPPVSFASMRMLRTNYASRLRNIHEAAANVTAPMTASGQSSGNSVPNPTPSR